MTSPFERLRDPRVIAMLQDVPQGAGPMTENQKNRADFLSSLSPEEFSALMGMVNNIPQQQQGGDLESALANNANPNPEEVQKAQVEAALDKEVDKGKNAQKVKNAIKSLDELRELRKQRHVEAQQQ